MDWSRFSLKRQPFRAAVDPEAYFPAESHESARAAIAEAFARRDPAVLIDGPTGVGKTLVARKWLEQVEPSVPRVVIPNFRAERPAELFQAILFDLGKSYQGLTEQELRLAVTGTLLDQATESAHPTVLVLDEAQNLNKTVVEELRLLGNLETRNGVAVFLVLVAQPSLRETLSHEEPFAQRLAVQAAVAPFLPEQSAEYLRHQVRVAGGDPGQILTDEAITLLAGAGRGIPRILNRAATLAFELAAAGEAEQVDAEAALEAIGRLGLGATESSEPADAVLLPHPARAAEPAKSRRGKPAIAQPAPEAGPVRASKEKRKRSA